MNRRLACALGALALGWIGSPALGQEVIRTTPQPAPAQTIVVKPDQALVAAQPAMCTDCGHQGSSFNFAGGAGVYYVRPQWDSNPAFFAIRDADLGIVSSGRQEDFKYDYEFAPRIWGGASNCDGIGGRARYWYFRSNADTAALDSDAGDDDVAITSPGPLGISVFSTGDAGDPQIFAAGTDLNVDVWDVEATATGSCCGVQLLFAGGVRYIELSQSYLAGAFDANSQDFVTLLSSGHNHRGFGPTAAIEARYGLAGTGANVYVSGRGSLIFGHRAQTVALLSPAVGFAEDAAASREDILPILEIEVGGEYTMDTQFGTAFVQGALVAQTWFGAGNASRANNNDVLGPLSGGTVDDNNLSFFGVTVTAGVRY